MFSNRHILYKTYAVLNISFKMFSLKHVNFKNAVRSFDTLILDCFTKHGVIPDVIDYCPKEICQVVYPCGYLVDRGNILTPTVVRNEPCVTWTAGRNVYYTLILTDPDAPSRKAPTYSEWHHWLVGNIPGCDISRGHTLSDYIGAGPPKNTGLHRYILLIFKQKGMYCFDRPHLTNKSVLNRELFSTRKLIAKYYLGPPVAGNFFQAEYDDYISTLYKQLGA